MGLFDDADLFFARKLQPLFDRTKMRKFTGSKTIIACFVSTAIYIPYWYSYI